MTVVEDMSVCATAAGLNALEPFTDYESMHAVRDLYLPLDERDVSGRLPLRPAGRSW
jgi:hypothetical protein